jgi:protein involved in polysaccharide export with SLBB domain
LTTVNQYPTNFEVLNDYTLTPGDVFTLLINYGANTERSADYITTYSIQLQQDFTLAFPFIGKINARGMTVENLKNFISKEIAEITPVQYISFYLASPAHFMYSFTAVSTFRVTSVQSRLQPSSMQYHNARGLRQKNAGNRSLHFSHNINKT